MWRELRALFGEPGPDRPSRPSAVDRALVLVLVPTAIGEGLLRGGLPLRPLQIAIGLATVSALWFRRSHPLGAVAAAFGLAIASTLAEIALGLPEVVLYTSTAVLLLPYSLLRWGSGREVAIGLGLIASAYLVSMLHGERHGAEDAVGAAVVLLFPAAVGASVRFRDHAHRRDVEHAKLREREMLARELHDTVAHHASAIVIQAQAARAVLAKRPEAAIAALSAIEAEAARALAELRSLVGALRDDAPAARAPQAGIADIERLARSAGERVAIERAGDLDGLPPSLQAALYRIAQESITNAVRHARAATHIRVRLAAEGDSVRLTVHDDGETPPARARTGFGLVGMTERATLLGGTLAAGPSPDGGWKVDAVLPRNGGAR